MSWFKKKVENWDMVGMALEREMRRSQVGDVAADEDAPEREVDLDALKRQVQLEAQKTKQVTKAVTDLMTDGA
jgi:hypothetical protein